MARYARPDPFVPNPAATTESQEIAMLNRKVAIVTGSTSGIGLGIARRLLERGATLILNGLGAPAEIEALRMELSNVGRVDFVDADMSRPQQVERLVRETESRHGRVDILVNNAGIQFTARTEAFPPERWDQIISINLSAAFHAIRSVLPGMIERGHGRIVNIASVHGLIASKEKSAYVAAKHGIVGLTKVVALENAEQDITCNAICPGWVDTPLVRRQIAERALREGITEEAATAALVGEKQPSQRFAQVDDLADAVVFLASPAGRSITGISLPVDGGWTAQ
jgi:3-hydroxybutyrate dehydrogenase